MSNTGSVGVTSTATASAASAAWAADSATTRAKAWPANPIDVAGKIKASILGLYGGKDGGIPVDTVKQMEAKVEASGNPNVEIVVYPDAPHAFHADYRPSYREAAAKDGWKRLTDWLKAHGAA